MRGSGLLADSTRRLRRDDLEIRHFAGVSCFAEHTVCAEQAVLKIPGDVPMPIAAVVGCAVMTGVGAVVNTARVEPGSTALVIGAGGVGLCAITGAALAGAVSTTPSRLTHTVEQAVRAVRVGGTALAVGIVPTGTTAQVNVQQLVMQEKTLKGSI
jgi:Zn-dependent alcohol dehydrogenase